MMRWRSSTVAGIAENMSSLIILIYQPLVCVFVAIVSIYHNPMLWCATLTQIIDASSLLLLCIVVHRVVTRAPRSAISDSRVFKHCRRNATSSSQSISPTASRCPRGLSPPSPKDVLNCRTSFCPVARASTRTVCCPLPRAVLAWSVSVWLTVT